MTYCYDFWQCKVSVLCTLLTTYPQHGPCMILQRNVKTRLYLRDNLLSSSVGAAPAGFWGCFAASLLSWPRSANLQKALSQELELWMENGKNNKIKEQFKAEMSTTDHTLLPGSPAVHLVSLCLICGHLWCALSLSSHLVSPCAPAASTGHHSRTFSPHARCQATGLACRRQAVPSGSIIARREARYFIDTNLKCAI